MKNKIISCIKKQIRDMSFKKKIIGICLLISLIPMVLLGVFFYHQMSEMLTERTEIELRETLRQETDHVNYRLETYLSMMDFVAADEKIKNALTMDYDQNYEMYITYRDIIDPLLETVRVLHQGIRHVTLYTTAGIYPHGTSVRMLEEAETMPWYDETCNSFESQFNVSEDGKVLYVTRRVYTGNFPYKNLLAVSVDIQDIFGSVETIYEDNFGFLLLDNNNQAVYQYTKFDDLEKFDALTVDQIISGKYPEKYVVQDQKLRAAGWKAVLYRPIEELEEALLEIIRIVMILVICSCIFVFFLCAKLAAMVAHPIMELSENMKCVEAGNYELTVQANGNDEVGHVIRSFREMVEQQNHLIHEVLYAKIAYQKYELRILQSQINPHFLYNALSLISSRALMRRQEDISQVALLLSTFYRTMLNKGKTVISVAEELENVKSYIAIQKMMHSNSFETVYEIDKELLDAQMPNMLLQPLAENAILHGLDNKETPGKGILTISCYREGTDLLFKVMDNGAGMTEEQCKKIVLEDSRGYGVKNVHQRVQLYFGEAYGLTYHSVLNRGSYVILRIKEEHEKESLKKL